MPELGTIIVGAGQAGLATSHELTQLGEEHVVLERGRIGESWRNRWDSFCLVTPNWSVQLPGFPYDGNDPDGFMPRDEIVAYLERYAASFDAPVKTGTDITSVERRNGAGFVVRTAEDDWYSENLVLATGAYQKPTRPHGADTLPDTVRQMNLLDFRNVDALPAGDVLIVGSGQSGCQIAEELLEAGRRVVLACGRAPWGPRKVGDHDVFWWLIESGFLDTPSEELPEEARLFANILATGHDGGHDINLRLLKEKGVTLVGHFIGAEANTAKFSADLGESLAWGDARYKQLRDVILATAKKIGVDSLDLPDPDPFLDNAPSEIDLESFGTVLFTGGFRPDYVSWLPWPEAFDDGGFPLQTDGASATVRGLYFAGVHLLRTRKSALLYGVGEDASILAKKIAMV